VGTSAQRALTTGSYNTAMGVDAQRALTTGSYNTAAGRLVQYFLTTGSENTAVGHLSQCSPLANSSYATNTANRQTSVGTESGQNTATQINEITTIGYRATAGAASATALGSQSRADHSASVALGSGTQTTAADQVMIGARDLEITSSSKGVVLKSPDGTRYRITVANGGTLTVTAI
jgi:hypothetical protein